MEVSMDYILKCYFLQLKDLTARFSELKLMKRKEKQLFKINI